MTPYPGTALHQRLAAEGRIVCDNWERYDTRHVVYRPLKMSPEELEAGYWRAYRDYYRWSAIASGAAGQDTVRAAARHLAYSGGWKKLEPMWDLVIRSKRVGAMLPMLEHTLDAFGGARKRSSVPRLRPASPMAASTPSSERAGADIADTSHRSAQRIR
jgi:hypothetical protein